jgi:arginine-tRNA-protein transferase
MARRAWPLERLGRDGWRRTDDIENDPLVSVPLVLPNRRDRSKLLIDA